MAKFNYFFLIWEREKNEKKMEDLRKGMRVEENIVVLVMNYGMNMNHSH